MTVQIQNDRSSSSFAAPDHSTADKITGATPTSRRTLRYRLYAGLFLADILCIVAGVAAGYLLRFGDLTEQSSVSVILGLLPLYAIFAINFSAYSVRALSSPERAAGAAVGSVIMAFLVLAIMSYFFRFEQEISRLALVAGIVTSSVLLFTIRYLRVASIVKRYGGALVPQALLVDLKGEEIPRRITGKTAGTFTRIDAHQEGLVANRRDPMMLNRLAERLDEFDRAVVMCRAADRAAWANILKSANVRAEIIVPEFDDLGAVSLSRFGGERTLVVGGGPMSLRDRILKRSFDLAIAVPAVLCLLPLLVLIAVAIRLDSPGPILFRQQRMGHRNRLFEVLKFRSMRVEATDHDGGRSTARDDDRVTRVGGFLRRTSLDELPQLFNVLNGTMSIVGPRPHALGSRAGGDHFWDVDDQYWHRHSLQPGITGLAQVRGFRGATHQREDLSRRLQADLEYVSGWSIWRDIAILVRTIRVVTHPNAF
ncbi:MAG: exopolysaccharide biosynthesis polyprenyl glycosylphosphotransferase [Pacificimonas sp.]